MRSPSPSDLNLLHGRSPAWYAHWLRIGLDEYQFERKGSEAFPGAENFVDQHEAPIAGELRRVVLALPRRDREAFKQGVAELLQSLDFADQHDAIIAQSVMQLGAGIGALGLLRILTSKSFSLSGDHGARLYDLAFDLAAHLPDLEPRDTVLCLKQLVRQRALFQPATAGRALIALTQAEPDAFTDHFQFLRHLLDEQYGYIIGDDPNERRRARLRKRLIEGLVPLLRDMSLLTRIKQGTEAPPWWLEAVQEHAPEGFHSFTSDPSGAAVPKPQEIEEHPPSKHARVFAWACAAIDSVRSVEKHRARRRGDPGEDATPLDHSQTGAHELATGLFDLGDVEPDRPSHCTWNEEPEDVCG